MPPGIGRMIRRDSLRNWVPHIELSLGHRGVSTTRLPGSFEPLLMLPAKSRRNPKRLSNAPTLALLKPANGGDDLSGS